MTSLKVTLTQLVLCVLLGVTGTNGKPPSAIVGGLVAAENEFPYQISLRVYGRHICGGSIIDSTHILTAAHCVEDATVKKLTHMTVVTSTNSISSGGKRHSIKRIMKHPLYSSSAATAWKNDIAVVTIKTPIVLNNRTKAIKLPTKNIVAGDVAIASGWGNHLYVNGPMPDNLRKLEMDLLSSSKCKVPGVGIISETHLCAYKKMGSGVCSGDSGGPLVVDEELVGITSFVIPCGKGYPDVFTRVYSYVDWINRTIKD